MRRFGLLFLLMFLEFAIWGAWLPVAGSYFQGGTPVGLGLNGMQMGILFALMPACSIFMSPIFGNLADRVINAEKLMAVLHLLSACALFGLSRQTTFAGTFTFLLIHCLLFSPTVALANAVVLHHLDEPEKQFGNIRVAGTIGWMVSLWILSGLRSIRTIQISGDLFVIAAILSVLLGLVCLFVPKTPPAKTPANRFAFGKAMQLMKNPNFMMLMVFSLVICTQFDFFYMFSPGYLTAPPLDVLKRYLPESYMQNGFAGLGIAPAKVSFFMSLAQVSEVVMMLSLPYFLKGLGYRWTIYLGVIAWCLRFVIYVFFTSVAATVISIMLHGFCIACFLVGGSLYVAGVASVDIRASAQALYSIVTFGFGRVLGAILGGYIESVNTSSLPAQISIPGIGSIDKLVNWQAIFVIPTGITFACVLVFPFVFRPKADEVNVPA